MKMRKSAKVARFVIFNSGFLPKTIGVPLRRMLRAKYMPRKKTATRPVAVV